MSKATTVPSWAEQRRRSQRIWTRIRKQLAAADPPADRHEELAARARRHLRLQREEPGLYRSRQEFPLMLRRTHNPFTGRVYWAWHHPDWEPRWPIEAGASMREALARWAAVMLDDDLPGSQP